jgi:hypothetical protein
MNNPLVAWAYLVLPGLLVYRDPDGRIWLRKDGKETFLAKI